jgi:hypothetical protein
MGVQHLAAVGGKALAAGVNLMLAERTTAATQVRLQRRQSLSTGPSVLIDSMFGSL